MTDTTTNHEMPPLESLNPFEDEDPWAALGVTEEHDTGTVKIPADIRKVLDYAVGYFAERKNRVQRKILCPDEETATLRRKQIKQYAAERGDVNTYPKVDENHVVYFRFVPKDDDSDSGVDSDS